MQIIKDKQVIEDTWKYITDDAELTNGNICVSLTRWKKDHEQLLADNRQIGIRINPTSSIEDLSNDLEHIELIELDFADFTDGRLFTYAWLLRNRYHFKGEIRATGNYMSGQVFYLSRVGVNAFTVEKSEDLNAKLTALNDFTVNYQ